MGDDAQPYGFEIKVFHFFWWIATGALMFLLGLLALRLGVEYQVGGLEQLGSMIFYEALPSPKLWNLLPYDFSNVKLVAGWTAALGFLIYLRRFCSRCAQGLVKKPGPKQVVMELK